VTHFGPRNEDLSPGLGAILISFESDIIRERRFGMECAIVRACDPRTLVAAVNDDDEAIAFEDAVMTERLSESPCVEWGGYAWCEATSQVAGRVLVVTGHDNGKV
jgi:hypothetical protein